MFNAHQPIIARYAQSSPDAMCKVLTFVQCTIGQHIERVPTMMRLLAETGSCNMLSKRQAHHIAEYFARRVEIYDALMSADTDIDRMMYIIMLPGFGIPKAGFVCQLIFGTVGCIDRHNLARYGLDAKAFRSDTTSVARLRERINTYLVVCSSIGCGELWDSWCDFVAAKRPKTFINGYAVSALHVSAIMEVSQ